MVAVLFKANSIHAIDHFFIGGGLVYHRGLHNLSRIYLVFPFVDIEGIGNSCDRGGVICIEP